MIIQHNMTAANANRQLAMSGTNLAKSTEKLSSGYRINRAADDAAGLSISEKMRGQIRGLNQASTNAQDGISMIQTAEGALSESQSILQRMRELSVQASNGTETDEDRANIQDEVNQLQDELTRIADTTEFNTMKLLDGSAGSNESKSGIKASVSFSTQALAAGALGTTAATAGTFTTGVVSVGQKDQESTFSVSYTTADGEVKTLSVDKTYEGGNAASAEATAKDFISKLEETELADSFTMKTDGTKGTIIFTAKDKGANGAVINSIAETQNGTAKANSITAVAGVDAFESVDAKVGSAASIDDLKDKIFEVNGQKFAYVDAAVADAIKDNQEYNDVNYVQVETDNTVVAGDAQKMAQLINNKTGLNASANGAKVDLKAAAETSSSTGGIELQVGANKGQTMTFTINDMSAKALGVDSNKVKVSTQEDAKKATSTIDDAINKVSKERAKLGAVQNRLEHTISNLDTSSENLQTAESRIRDVDMADEMVNYSKHNILQQASQSMLAQAKNSTQGVLSLLQ